MRKYTLIMVLVSALVLAGCNTQVTFTKVDKDKFSMDVPTHWKEQTADASAGEIAYYSDNDANSFYEGAVGVYYYEDLEEEGAKLDQAYCDDTYDFVAQSSPDSNFNGANKRKVQFVAAADPKSAYCEIEYELVNSGADKDFVAKQVQKQHIFLVGKSVLIVEIGTTKEVIPEYIQHVLASFVAK